jgi:hypothetical protein
VFGSPLDSLARALVAGDGNKKGRLVCRQPPKPVLITTNRKENRWRDAIVRTAGIGSDAPSESIVRRALAIRPIRVTVTAADRVHDGRVK